MVITAGAVIGPVLAGGAIGLTGNARPVVVILKVPVRADLQTDGQIGHVQVRRGAGQAAVLAGTGTGFARFVTRPTDATLVGEATRWTSANASIV